MIVFQGCREESISGPVVAGSEKFVARWVGSWKDMEEE